MFFLEKKLTLYQLVHKLVYTLLDLVCRFSLQRLKIKQERKTGLISCLSLLFLAYTHTLLKINSLYGRTGELF